MRTEKEINDKIKDLYTLSAEGKVNLVQAITYSDALCWVLGEDYLDGYKTIDYQKLYECKCDETDTLYRIINQIYSELSLLKLKDCPEEEFHNIPLEICYWIEKLDKIRKETEVKKDGIHK